MAFPSLEATVEDMILSAITFTLSEGETLVIFEYRLLSFNSASAIPSENMTIRSPGDSSVVCSRGSQSSKIPRGKAPADRRFTLFSLMI